MLKKKHLYIPLGILIFMTLGTIYSWSVFRKPLQIALNLNATESGLPYTIFLMCYALTMPIAGSFLDKIGPRLTIIFGGILVGIAWFLSSYATNIGFLIFTYGVLGGIGVGIVYGAPMSVAAKWFPNNKGLAVGATLAGFGLSPFITAPLASNLIEKFGIFSTFKILGIVFIVINVILALPFEYPKENTYNLIKENKKSKNYTLKEMLNTKEFYILFITYTIGTFVGLMIIGISSPFAQNLLNISPKQAAIYVSFFAIFNGIGRPLFGILVDKFGVKISINVSYFILLISSIIVILTGEHSIIAYIISFSMFWLNLGGWLSIAPAATSKIFGSKNYSQNYGVMFLAYGIGALLAGIISGIIKDTFGSYIYVFYPVILLLIIGIILVNLNLKEKEILKKISL
ncbi:nitrate/nitrite transporter NarK [Hypnocyclicus thermotrophus]|uniref:Nitrate/nitrite transporter NarK n=1 Tax=Hypnocyclicus thermotrophus TaxID=1627895 RepID=A0AA46I6K0_9FUSO|nr:OFA family MFS transporter [Hypnocyclicus thermotrophus]TDT72535.1 nitrate/nitrite transporter NarK [Hypnocyclicus thermotrophus]